MTTVIAKQSGVAIGRRELQQLDVDGRKPR